MSLDIGDMPISVDHYNVDIVNHIKALDPKLVLDVGAGMGKYGDLCRSLGIIADAIEPVNQYVMDYSLHLKYRDVFNIDAKTFFQTNRTHKYDLIIAGDVMEHMFLNDAIGVIDAMLYKSKHVMLIWPTNLPQDDQFQDHHEMHLSNIKLSDIARFNVEVYKRTFTETFNDNPIYAHYALIAGHNVKYNEGLRRLHIEDRIAKYIINDV